MKTLPFCMVLFVLLVAAAATSCRSKERNDEVFQTLDKELVYLSADYRKMNGDMMLLLKRKVANAEGDENAQNVFLQATKASAVVRELEQFIEHLKIELVEYDQVQVFEDYLDGEILLDIGNTEAVRNVLFSETLEGRELMAKINDTRFQLLNFSNAIPDLSDSKIIELDSRLSLRAYDQADPEMLWEFKMFDGLPKSAALAMLNMMESQTLRAERVFLETCLNQLTSSEL